VKLQRAEIRIRRQLIKDAKRFYEILNHPDFIYFPVAPKSIEEEKRYLRGHKERRETNHSHNFAILVDDEVVGAVGLKIDSGRPYIGEIGYFVDHAYWGQGVASKAVGLVEEMGFSELGLERIEIMMVPANVGSVRVAEKCDYQFEGVMRGTLRLGPEGLEDARLYAKTKADWKA
jgi:ribosomal-protein-alanine N-acetyltransferase